MTDLPEAVFNHRTIQVTAGPCMSSVSGAASSMYRTMDMMGVIPLPAANKTMLRCRVSSK
jgi:hypothetical protein